MEDAIRIEHLKKYYGRSRGVEDTSLSVPQGGIYGFIGPNGAGKSTTIKILFHFITQDSGIASVLGMDAKIEGPRIKREVGYVPSDVRYYPFMTGREIVQRTLSFYHMDWNAEIDRMAQYLMMDLGKKISQLSMGNKKKIAILCALCHNPRLIILDEPTSGLDPLIQKRLFDLLKERVGRVEGRPGETENARGDNPTGVTVFLSSHNLTEVQNYCDKVAFIKEGKIVKVQDLSEDKRLFTKSVTMMGGDLTTDQLRDFGCRDITQEGEQLHFHYRGDMEPLLALLAAHHPSDLLMENLSLEEEFMNYYEEVAEHGSL